MRNVGKEPARLEVQATAWSQGIDGAVQTVPTEELLVFPPLVTVAPGEERNLRLGTTAKSGATERSYRVFVQELPPPERPGEPQQVRVLSRIGIPVFLAPERSAARAVLGDLRAAGGKATFTLRNDGTTRVRPAKVQLTGRGADGQVLFARALDAWYVLAGGERRYQLPIPAGECRALRQLQVQVELGSGQPPLHAEEAVGEGACAP